MHRGKNCKLPTTHFQLRSVDKGDTLCLFVSALINKCFFGSLYCHAFSHFCGVCVCVCVCVILLAYMAPSCSAKVLHSVPKHKTVMCLKGNACIV
jgi:hypothetical protein